MMQMEIKSINEPKRIIRQRANSENSEVQKLLLDTAKARFVCELVAYALAIDEDLMCPTRGSPNSALARQISMYLCHIGFGMSLNRVANAFGRDRSTIAHACHQIEDRRDDSNYDTLLDELENALKTVPKPNYKALN